MKTAEQIAADQTDAKRDAQIEMARKECRRLNRLANAAGKRGDYLRMAEWTRQLLSARGLFPTGYVQPAWSDF